MKNLLLILIFGMFTLSAYSQEVVSTGTGGDWNNFQTWVNGKIPDANSDVVIHGNVKVDAPIQCKNLKISKDGIIEFAKTQDSLTSTISETLNVDDGKIIVGDKWVLYIAKVEKTDLAEIENYGTLTVGQ